MNITVLLRKHPLPGYPGAYAVEYFNPERMVRVASYPTIAEAVKSDADAAIHPDDWRMPTLEMQRTHPDVHRWLVLAQ